MIYTDDNGVNLCLMHCDKLIEQIKDEERSINDCFQGNISEKYIMVLHQEIESINNIKNKINY